MSKEAKLKILYEDGNPDIKQAWAFSVELRRWQCGEIIDYVLELAYTTDEMEPGANMLDWHKLVVITKWLDAKSDAQAIRAAVKVQSRLEISLANKSPTSVHED